MATLKEIEAINAKQGRRWGRAYTDHVDLLIRAVRQLGAAYQRDARDIEFSGVDPDILELIAEGNASYQK